MTQRKEVAGLTPGSRVGQEPRADARAPVGGGRGGAQALRQVMGRFATGVTVVTTIHRDADERDAAGDPAVRDQRAGV